MNYTIVVYSIEEKKALLNMIHSERISDKENSVWFDLVHSYDIKEHTPHENERIYDLDLDKYPEYKNILNNNELTEYMIKYDKDIHKKKIKYDTKETDKKRFKFYNTIKYDLY